MGNEEQQHCAARGAPNTIDSGPEFWGLRVVQDVPALEGRREDCEFYQGDLSEREAGRAYADTNQVNPLYRSGAPASGPDAIPHCTKEDSEVPAGAAYRNRIYRLPRTENRSRFVIDLFNNREADEASAAINAMLRKMVMLAPTRTNTWAVRSTGQFSYHTSVRIRSGPFPTEQIILKCHIYIRNGDRYTDVLNYFRTRTTEPYADDSEAYRRWKNMGSDRTDLDRNGRIMGESQNRIEPGINHLVVVLNRQDGGSVRIEEIYLDGDRMVLE